jgi:plastocyanin
VAAARRDGPGWQIGREAISCRAAGVPYDRGAVLRGKTRAVVVVAAIAAVLGCAQPAMAGPPVAELGSVTPLGSDVVRLHYKYGPLHVAPGQNLILIGPVTIEKPAYDGYAIRIKPNLVRADGSVPPVDVIHLHHGVWLNLSGPDRTAGAGGGEKFFAAGEEKTIFSMPPGYGYPVKGSDVWAVNYMLHNQTPVPDNVWITYDIDYVPANTDRGRKMKAVHPIWMDVENGNAYPVFDVHRGSGAGGKFTFPDNAANPYPDGRRRNEWTVDRNGTLVATAGHVHPGGLYTDLKVVRRGQPNPALAFRSSAKYFDPRGPVSWDLAMTGTDPRWRVGLRKGDKLRVSAAYDTTRASWYESMGIMVAYMADGQAGPDPFKDTILTTGQTTHGHLAENNNHGGDPTGLPDPRTLPDGQTLNNEVGIFGFTYMPGNIGGAGPFGNPPAVKRGQPLTFENPDASAQVFHTITGCRTPCNASTGISYPLANGPIDFDSGELGYGPSGFTAASNRHKWSTPSSLRPGTYTYFCRIHPYMRGAFRVK